MRGCPFEILLLILLLCLWQKPLGMTLRPNSIVHEVIYDPETKKASGVRVIDAETKESMVFKVVFL